MALLISAAGSVLGTLVVTPAKWLWNKMTARRTAESHDRSVAAGRDVSGQVATGDQSTVAGQAGVVMGSGSTLVQRGLDEESRARLVRIEASLEELKESSVAPSPGTLATGTDALLIESADTTERLLAEAVELQRQHKERAAIDCLLEAYRRDLPPQAKWQLHMLAGNGFLHLTELEEAEAQYLQALAAAETAGNKRGQASALGSLGIVHNLRGNFEKAEEHHMQALAIFEHSGDKRNEASVLGNLGLVYFNRSDLENAEQHFNKALAILEESGDRLGQAIQLSNLGTVCGRRRDLDKAEKYFERALSIYEAEGSRADQGRDLSNFGNLARLRGDLDRAEQFHRRALARDEQIGNRFDQAKSLGNLANVYSDRGAVEEAKEHYMKALSLFEDIGASGEAAKTRRLLDKLRSAHR